MTDTGKSSCIVVVNGEWEALVVSRKDGSGFAFPGGKMEPHETPKICACRELYEETALRVFPGRLVLLHVGPSPSGRIVHLYYAHKVFGEPRAEETGTSIDWMTLGKLLTQTPFGDFYRTALPDGIAHLRPTERG